MLNLQPIFRSILLAVYLGAEDFSLTFPAEFDFLTACQPSGILCLYNEMFDLG
jgi:hypothetical protein